MASTYSTNLRIQLITTGEQANTWGDTTNTNLGTLIEEAISGSVSVSVTAGDVTLSKQDGSSDQSRQMVIIATGTPGVTRTITAPASSKIYIVHNNSNAALNFIALGGAGVSFAIGAKKVIYFDGTNFVEAVNALTTPSVSGNLTISGSGGALRGSYGTGNVITNLALGDSALAANTTGGGNTAVGLEALLSNTTGNSNSAMGRDALAANTTGTNNSAVGMNALQLNTTGGANTAMGQQSLQNNTTGTSNSAVGTNALQKNTTGTSNSAMGMSALLSNTTGAQNSAMGMSALRFNTTGDNNSAVGYASLQNNTTGTSNSAIGASALAANTIGANNSAIGASALLSNTEGSQNSAIGANALQKNTTGNYNSAVGASALINNTTGISNSAMGRNTLFSNTTGDYNSAVGYASLQNNTTGVHNSAIGASALATNTTGNYNSAIGSNALLSNTTGNYNSAIGSNALQNNTTGSGNSAFNPLNSAGTYAPVFNPTTENNRFCMGSTAVTNAYVQVTWTYVSDARDKTNFAPVPHGLEFVNQLKPTAYQFKENRETDVPTGIVRYGFKAQDILALEGDTPVIIDTEDLEKLRFNSESLIPVLVNAIKELKAEIDLLKAKV